MKEKQIIGWREWISLPDLDIKKVKAKIDTGALTSAIHATDIEVRPGSRRDMVHFTIHPFQDSLKSTVRCKSPLLEWRKVKSSVGTTTNRPVVETTLVFGDKVVETELTLVNRDMMGFRMLVGRRALRKLFLVDAGRSFLLTKKKTKKKKKVKSKIQIKSKTTVIKPSDRKRTKKKGT